MAHSDWAIPVVAGLKKIEDYKVMINQVLYTYM